MASTPPKTDPHPDSPPVEPTRRPDEIIPPPGDIDQPAPDRVDPEPVPDDRTRERPGYQP